MLSIHYYMKDKKVYSFSSYTKALHLDDTPQVISIREHQTPPTQLIDFLEKQNNHFPRPQIILAYDSNHIPTIKYLINHFHFFRIASPSLSDRELEKLSFQALDLPDSRQPTALQHEITGHYLAHEINNPLGGMISFIKLIKMESSEKTPHYTDILKMEEAGQNCKKIVELSLFDNN